MAKIIDPYGSELVEDYEKIVNDFGLEVFKVDDFPKPNRIMKRGVVFAGRDMKMISKCIKEKKKFYVLTGLMPTGDKIHFGNKLVVENMRYFQEQGAEAFILIADLEAMAARGVSLEEGRKRAMDFHIPAYLALGLDPKSLRTSTNSSADSTPFSQNLARPFKISPSQACCAPSIAPANAFCSSGYSFRAL